MKHLVDYLKTAGIFLAFLFCFSLFMALLNLIGVSSSITVFFDMIATFLFFFFMGMKYGKLRDTRGFVAGIIIGLILLFLLLMLSFLGFDSVFSLSKIIYYFILLMGSVAGSMIGINKKEKKK